MRTLALATAVLAMACSTAPSGQNAQSPTGDGTAPDEAQPGPLPDRDPDLAKRMIEEDGGILLDVRTPEEFQEAHLAGAVNISHDQLESQLAEIETLSGGDKAKPIVTYCRSGNRAGKARTTLEAAGYTNVTNVGGMTDYPAQ